MRLLLVDNYDSFTGNLAQLFAGLGAEVVVRRNDALDAEAAAALQPRWVCISPGPRDPAHAGTSKDIIRRLGPTVPVLGVCLGMQAINEVYGGRTVRAPAPVHGRRSPITHDGLGLFEGLPSPFEAARYHSLCVEIRSADLAPCAWSEDGVVMALRHAHFPVVGVQFHPESFMTEHGRQIAERFLAMEGR